MVDSRKTYIPKEGSERKEGYMRLKVLKNIDKSLANVVDHLADNAETQASGTPAVDTGFFYMGPAQAETIDHGLGQTPTRLALFFSNVQDPQANQNVIHAIPSLFYHDGTNDLGVRVEHLSENSLNVRTNAYLFGSETMGYVRLLIWR
jgi:hypothetical protein